MSRFISFASVISEIQQSDVFMTVKARICEAPQANLNGARVTEAFIDEIVGNETRYVGLPLYADVKSLIGGKYNRLGHLYDSRTGEFHSTQIGSFYQFEKEEFDEGCALIGYARIPKRNKKLSKAISELFTEGKLKFSFELAVGEYEELDDDTILIDASENNYLEGTAIVTFPACEEAVALQLVAQQTDDRKGDAGMTEVKEVAENVTETNAEVVEEVTAEEEENVEAEENASCKKKEEENAEVVIREGHTEVHEQCAYDTTTQNEVCQRVVIETHSVSVEDGQLVETDDGPHVAEVAEAGGESGGEAGGNEPAANPEADPAEASGAKSGGSGDNTSTVTPAEAPENAPAEAADIEDVEVVDGDETKKTAEQYFAELSEVIESLRKEIAELKEAKAEKKVTAEINPFIGSIQETKTYSLLEKEPVKKNEYSLLGKA